MRPGDEEIDDMTAEQAFAFQAAYAAVVSVFSIIAWMVQ
mgnify:FL=1